MRQYILSFLAALIFVHSFAQDNVNQPIIDSLLNLITRTTPQHQRAKYYNEIARYTSNTDTMLKYANWAIDLCGERDTLQRTKANYYVGKAYYMSDKAQNAIAPFLRVAQLSNQTANYDGEGKAYIALGCCYEDLNEQDSIFYYFKKVLRTFIDCKDTAFISHTYQRIGQLYANIEFFSAAQDNYQQALHYISTTKDTLEIATCNYLIGDLQQKWEIY